MENLKKVLDEIQSETVKITVSKNGKESVHQTQRNNIKKRIVDAIAQDVAEFFPYVFRNSDGILLEIANQSVADNINNQDGSGAITVAIDCSIKGLDFNAEFEAEKYSADQEQKAKAKAEKAQAKAEKIAKDKAKRAE